MSRSAPSAVAHRCRRASSSASMAVGLGSWRRIGERRSLFGQRRVAWPRSRRVCAGRQAVPAAKTSASAPSSSMRTSSGARPSGVGAAPAEPVHQATEPALGAGCGGAVRRGAVPSCRARRRPRISRPRSPVAGTARSKAPASSVEQREHVRIGGGRGIVAADHLEPGLQVFARRGRRHPPAGGTPRRHRQ